MAALVGAAGLIWQLAAAKDDLVDVREQRDQARDALAMAHANAEAAAQRYDKLLSVVALRDAQLEAATQQVEQRRDAAQRLEVDDDETRVWAARPVPGAVTQWVRDLATPADGGDGVSDPARLDDPAAAGPAPTDPPQP